MLDQIVPPEATGVRLVVLDRDGKTVENVDAHRFLREFARAGTIAGMPDACIGVRYDDHGCDVALALTLDEVRALVGGAS